MNLHHLTYQDIAMASRPAGTAARKGSIGPGFKVKTRTPVKTANEPPPKKTIPPKKEGKEPAKTTKVKGVPFIKLYANALHTDSKYVGDVTVIQLNKGKFNDWPGFLSRTVTVDGSGPPRRYRHHVVAKDGLPIRLSNAVHVVCNCFVGDTKVLTVDGWKSMYELLDSTSDHRTDEPVSYVVNGEVKKGSVSFFTGKKPVWKIKLDNGTELTATKKQKVLVYRESKQTTLYQKVGIDQRGARNGRSFTWNLTLRSGKTIEVSDLKQWARDNDCNYVNLINRGSNRLVELAVKKCKNKTIRRDRPYIGGYVTPILKWVSLENLHIGDKIVTNSVNKLAETKRDLRYWESYFLGAFHGDGALNPLCLYVYTYLDILNLVAKSGVGLTQESSDKDSQSYGRYLLNRRGKELLEANGIRQDCRHHIPSFDKINVYAFLSGLIDTDGYISEDGRGVVYGTKNLRSLFEELLSIGIPNVQFGINRMKGVETNKGVSTRDMYALQISADGMRLLSPNLESVKYKKYVPKNTKQNRVSASKVSYIEYAGRQNVYDITVPQGEQFVANGMIVHNCPRFLYYWEYALASRGAADILYCNGEPPVITNPRLVPSACKHLLAVMGEIVRKKL